MALSGISDRCGRDSRRGSRERKEVAVLRGTVMYAPGDVRVEDRPEAVIQKPTDAVIRLSATCICGIRPMALPWGGRGVGADSHGP